MCHVAYKNLFPYRPLSIYFPIVIIYFVECSKFFESMILDVVLR